MHIFLASSASLTGYADLVSELGGNPEELMACADIPLTLLDGQERMINGESLSRLFDLSAQRLDCPAFCLLLSQRQDLSVLGPVGLMMAQSACFGDAYQVLEKYIHLRSEAGTFSLEVHGDLAIIKYVPHVQGHNQVQQICDLSLGIGCHLIRSYIGKHWKPRAVYFRHKAPSDMAAYSMLFRSPLSFEQEFNGLVFDAGLLQAPLGRDDTEIRQFLGRYLDALNEAKSLDVIQQCTMLIREQLAAGACSLKSVAQALGLTERTLQRRLRAQNSRYQNLLAKIRKEISAESLGSPGMNITLLSQQLGYADVSSFSKAYKSWFGVSPSHHKASEHSE